LFACTALAQIVDGLFGQPVELARDGVAPDLLIEERRVKLLKPDAKLRELVGRQLGDGLFNVLNSHGRYISCLRAGLMARQGPTGLR
jgi:hypothetical protein